MEILDKNKINSVIEYYKKLRKLFVKTFRKQPKESVGIYISDDYVYMASIFYESGNWHLFSIDKEELPQYNYEEVAANWASEKINKLDLNNAAISMGTPDKMLIKRDVELENVPEENLQEALHWDFVVNFFENNEVFNVAYYPIDEGLYFAAGLEVKNQKYVDEVFGKKDITITKWVTFPDIFKLELKEQNAVIFKKDVKIPPDMDTTKLKEYTTAIYAAMVGANLFEGEENILFPPPYDIEYLNWKLIAIIVFLGGISLVGSVFLYDNLRLKFLHKDLDTVKTEYNKLSVDRTRMKIYNDIVKDTKMREKIVAEITKNRIPFQGVLLHLGTLTLDGVVLNSVKSDKNKIIIEGEADTEDDLENYLTLINERKDIFITYPKSLKIEKNEKVKFSFVIDLQV